MNRRGKRLTLGVMAVGIAVVIVLAIAHWGTVRDHMEAWHFQLTTETETITPQAPSEASRLSLRYWSAFLAHYSKQPVILAVDSTDGELALWRGRSPDEVAKLQKILQANGYRVLEQRFPRRAYVVIRSSASQPPPQASPPQTVMSASMKEQLERALNEAAKSEALKRAQREP